MPLLINDSTPQKQALPEVKESSRIKRSHTPSATVLNNQIKII